MTLLDEQACKQVAEAIRRIEASTDAELVTVLADRADDYTYIPLLWAALAALLLPGALAFLPGWLEPGYLLLAQWSCFIVLALLFRLPAIAPRLIPRRVGHWRAANLARRQFLEQGLHHTRDATGLLIFVSEAERYVEILADRGISTHIDDAEWARIVQQFTVAVREGRTLEGFLGCIEACGERLARALPATHDSNELPDRLILIYH